MLPISTNRVNISKTMKATMAQSAQQWRVQCHSQHNNEGYNGTVSTIMKVQWHSQHNNEGYYGTVSTKMNSTMEVSKTMKGTMSQSAQQWRYNVQSHSQHNNEGCSVTFSTNIKGEVQLSAQQWRVLCQSAQQWRVVSKYLS